MSSSVSPDAESRKVSEKGPVVCCATRPPFDDTSHTAAIRRIETTRSRPPSFPAHVGLKMHGATRRAFASTSEIAWATMSGVACTHPARSSASRKVPTVPPLTQPTVCSPSVFFGRPGFRLTSETRPTETRCATTALSTSSGSCVPRGNVRSTSPTRTTAAGPFTIQVTTDRSR